MDIAPAQALVRKVAQSIWENDESGGWLARVLTETGMPVEDVALARHPVTDIPVDLVTLASDVNPYPRLQALCAVRFRLGCLLASTHDRKSVDLANDPVFQTTRSTLVAAVNTDVPSGRFGTGYTTVTGSKITSFVTAAAFASSQTGGFIGLQPTKKHNEYAVGEGSGPIHRKLLPTVTLLAGATYKKSITTLGNTLQLHKPDVVVVHGEVSSAMNERLLGKGYASTSGMSFGKSPDLKAVVYYRTDTVTLVGDVQTRQLATCPYCFVDFRFNGEALIPPGEKLYSLRTSPKLKRAVKLVEEHSIKIKPSQIPQAGLGAFYEGKNPIPAGKTIGVYEGVLRRENPPLAIVSQYAIENKFKPPVYVDARDKEYSNWTRYMNDPQASTGFTPNVFINDKFHVVTTQTIPPKTELFFSYGEPYWQDDE